MLLCVALEKAHPGLYRYVPKSDIDAAFDKLEKRVKTRSQILVFLGKYR